MSTLNQKWCIKQKQEQRSLGGWVVEFTWGKEHRVENTRIKGGKGRRKRGKRLTPAGYL